MWNLATWSPVDCQMIASWLSSDCQLIAKWSPVDCHVIASWLPSDRHFIERWTVSYKITPGLDYNGLNIREKRRADITFVFLCRRGQRNSSEAVGVRRETPHVHACTNPVWLDRCKLLLGAATTPTINHTETRVLTTCNTVCSAMAGPIVYPLGGQLWN